MANPSDSNQITRDYFDSLLIETRYINSTLPTVNTKFLGYEFDTPIMTAALSHLHNVCENGMTEHANAAAKSNAACFVGMGEDKELEDMLSTGAKIIKIIKPHEDNNVIFHKIEHAVQNGAIAVGMDIDHAFSGCGTYDNVYGLPMKSKSFEEMKEFINYSKVPFVVKGVLSVHDALLCADARAKAIIVSHHHGIMPYSVPPLMVLPEIVKAVGNSVEIIVDCGIESGIDAFKALALGANGVCVGRNLMNALKDGSDAMSARINEITNELKSIMARTGATCISDIDNTVIHRRNF